MNILKYCKSKVSKSNLLLLQLINLGKVVVETRINLLLWFDPWWIYSRSRICWHWICCCSLKSNTLIGTLTWRTCCLRQLSCSSYFFLAISPRHALFSLPRLYNHSFHLGSFPVSQFPGRASAPRSQSVSAELPVFASARHVAPAQLPFSPLVLAHAARALLDRLSRQYPPSLGPESSYRIIALCQSRQIPRCRPCRFRTWPWFVSLWSHDEFPQLALSDDVARHFGVLSWHCHLRCEQAAFWGQQLWVAPAQAPRWVPQSQASSNLAQFCCGAVGTYSTRSASLRSRATA